MWRTLAHKPTYRRGKDEKTLIALLALLLALTTGAALASGHRHGRHANAGHCYAAGNATSYCHYDGTCTHGGDACHFYADEDGDGICDHCSTHWSFEDGAWCGHSHVDADGDGICDNCPAHPRAQTVPGTATAMWTRMATAFATVAPRRRAAAVAITAATAEADRHPRAWAKPTAVKTTQGGRWQFSLLQPCVPMPAPWRFYF